MLRKTSLLLSVLLLCLWGGMPQDFMSPNLNIIAELGKIKNIEETLKNQNITVTFLNSSVEELKKENAALRTIAETSQKSLKSLQQENIALMTTARSYQEKLESLQQENNALKMKVEALQNSNEARKVAFSASLLASGTGHTGPFISVKNPLIYKKVFTNYGNAYDSNTGIFTTPLTGVYFFRFYAHCHSGITMAIRLYKNDQVQCAVHSYKPVASGNASNGIVLTLEKGDQIYTKIWDNTWVYDDPNSYTSFSGFLLFPL